jgi:GMP synthase-like glutamine amidotransferase
MRIHYFQHVPEEDLGSIEPWAHEHSHLLSASRFYLNEPLPALDNFDMLVIMGGQMSANDEETIPWLTPELELIGQAIEQGKTVLGVCLGAQLIAKALGGTIFKNPQQEIGWFPIRLTEAGQKSFLLGFLPLEMTVFHWHGETFTLPAHATLLASSEACPHQAFSFGRNEQVLGLQFHCEVTSEIITAVERGAEKLEVSSFVQSRETIQSHYNKCPELHQMMAEILDRLTRQKR